jgi:sec-independent protein translocase protein TatA
VLSHWYVLVILGVIALIIFGPKRLPEIGAGLGRAISEFKKGATEVRDSVNDPPPPSQPPNAIVPPPVQAAPGAPVDPPGSSTDPTNAGAPPSTHGAA